MAMDGKLGTAAIPRHQKRAGRPEILIARLRDSCLPGKWTGVMFMA